MTVQQIIEMVDVLRPNTIPDEMKSYWLKSLDARLRRSIVQQHQREGVPALGTGADVDSTLQASLLVPAPYDEIYPYWLSAQIDFVLGEITRYNNSMALYNAALDSFSAAYKAGHRPLPRGQFVL